MLRTLLHKTLLTAIAILLAGWAVVAQHNVVKGTALSFKADENPAIDFRWEIYNVDAGTTFNLTSNTHVSEEYTFSTPGNYEVRVYPVDKLNRCIGEPLVSQVSVVVELPTISFDDLSELYVCSANNGVNPNAEINCTVNYTGPIPWTFKYSVDREPAILPEGANEIWTSTFDFVVTIRNNTGNLSRSEIMLVEAKSISGLEIEENIDDHRVGIDVLYLPDTKFLDFESIALAGSLQSFKAIILKHDPDITPASPASSKRYEILFPDGATLLNENTTILADNRHSELTFDILWGHELGPNKVKLIEKNAFNCNGDTITADINLIESFLVDLGDDKDICKGSNVELKPTINLDGTFTYKWSTGEETETIRVSEEGTYTLTVTETNSNKISNASIQVSHLDTPVVDLGEDYVLADGEVITLDAGPGGTYLWSNDAILQTIEVDKSGLYSVTVTGSNGCQASDEINITSVNDDFVIDLGADIIACINDMVILDPKPNPTSTREYSYLWSTDAITPTISVSEPGVYSVVVTDDKGHVERDDISVSFNALPIVDLGPDQFIYEGESLILDAGDAGVGASYFWNTEEVTQTIEVIVEGDYWLKITDNNGCVGRGDVKLTQNEGQKFTVDFGEDIEICEGERAYLEPIVKGISGDTIYKWIPGESTEKGIYVDKKGKYCVKVSDVFGNSETACVDVDINPSPIVDLGNDIKLDVGEAVVLDAGNDGVSYVWSINDIISDTEVSSTMEVSSTGDYSVEVTGPKDCVGRDAVNVYSKGRRYLPSAFSPNSTRNDNRKLLVKEKYAGEIKKLTFVIYNRGGQKIFQSNRIDIGWDGTYKGELQRMDTYVYFLKITLDNNTTETQRGEVTLLN